MSGIVLSAAVRQNLLSLQSTASLLATTQNDLATGNKINSALDNPTNYFTAQGLNGRASDISNLLDSISNGVQVLQAANTGITSMQSLIDNAKSVATQALQTSSGYDTPSQVTSTAITGAGGAAATANNLLGAGTALSTAVPGTAVAGLGSPSTMLTSLGSAITTGDSLTVNGKTISFVNTGKGNSISAGGATLDLASATIGDLLGAIDTITGTSTASTASGGAITLQTGASSDLTLAGTALAKLGLTTGTTAPTGLTLTVGATGGGTATSITFGTGAGQVSTLNQLNAALAANNLQASLSSTGAIRLSTTNDAASATMGAIGGTAAAAGGAFNGLVAAPPVADPNSQATRANLVAQYNNLIQQLTTTAQDASYNGINLLNGDTLKMTFDETGKSTLSVQGLTLDSTGLGLSKLTAGTDFIDNNSTNSVLSQLNAASTTLRAEASSFGSNLSLVEIRQDFNKNLVNLLQTGASNLTLADTNELAADSQALSTRQSIAVSALGLANQSQQAVLQLLR